MSLSFLVNGSTTTVEPTAVAIAGFTGRDREAVEHHLEELRAIGVPTPTRVPCYYPAPPSLLVQSDEIVTTHDETSGEAEVVLVLDGTRAWLTLGSDHTDRAAEALDIALSKVATPKPIAREAWSFDSVADHLDQIRLRSWIIENGTETLYQDGALDAFVAVDELARRAPFVEAPQTYVVFGGTLAALGGIRPASSFRAELHDPVSDRTISLQYSIRVLAMLDDEGSAS